MRSFVTFTSIWIINEEDMGAAWRRSKTHMEFWLENLKERDYIEDTGLDGRTTL
jgi:hypothetical protein